MYQAWQWGGTPGATAQPAAVGQVGATAQWPAGYNYAAMTPEMQQQWAAAWASQAYAYSGAVPAVAGQAANPYSAACPAATLEADSNNVQQSSTEQPKNSATEAQLDKEEEEFEKQFKDWEKQFDAWKEQNANHPDKEAFAQYEKQWQEWRAQLLQKKEDMQKAKAERAAAAAAAAATNTATTNTQAAVDPNAAMYYQQQAQYMYMQNFMYPGGMPGVTPGGAAQPGYPSYGAEGYPQGDGSGQDTQQQNPNGPPKDMNNFDQEQYGEGENFPPQGDYQNYDEYGNMCPPNMDPEQYNQDMNFRGRGPRGRVRGRGRGRGRGGRWGDPNGDGMPPDMRGPGLLDNPGDYPPEDFHDGPPGNFGRGPLRDYPDGMGGPLDKQGPPFNPDESPRKRRNNDRFSGPPGKLSRDKMSEGPPPQPSNRYPPDEFEEEFPEPPFDEPPFEGGDFPPMDDFGGRPPPFRDDFGPPPFDNRFPRGRGGRFGPRGRFGGPPPPDFDRFGGPPFPDDGPPPFGPPGDRFFDGPRGRGPRHFGPGGRFHDDQFYRGGGPMRFKSKDYTHRSAEDFDPHYEFENDFNEDVMQFRAKRGKRYNNKRRGKAADPPQPDREDSKSSE